MKPRGRRFTGATRHKRGWHSMVYTVIAILSIRTTTPVESTTSSRLGPSVQRVVLLIDCGNCGKPCTSSLTGCPDCPLRLEDAVKQLHGVYSALFKAGYATGNATIEYNSTKVSLQAIVGIIKQTPPYPVCCTGISQLA